MLMRVFVPATQGTAALNTADAIRLTLGYQHVTWRRTM
jgi:hypothetical protein